MNKTLNCMLCQFGLSPSSVCFWYASAALGIVRQDPQVLTNLTKCVYPKIAGAHDVSPAAVESGLRRAVDTCWEKDPGLLEIIMHKTLPKRPTVGQFLAAIVMYI